MGICSLYDSSSLLKLIRGSIDNILGLLGFLFYDVVGRNVDSIDICFDFLNVLGHLIKNEILDVIFDIEFMLLFLQELFDSVKCIQLFLSVVHSITEQVAEKTDQND